MKNILFIVNPISGTKRKEILPHLIEKESKKSGFSYQIRYTKAAKHAIEISKNERQNFDIIVAVGGDGTVNEVANGLIGGEAALGIVPMGSGNGLARYLKYSMNVKKSIQQIANFNIHKVDHISINQKYNSFNVCGLGFDAHISEKFHNHGKRGLFSYIKLIIREFFNYTDKNYSITIDTNTKIERKAFMISIGNSTQFGNNAHICPHAKINDGLMDICITKKFPLRAAPKIVLQMMTKKLHKSQYCEYFKAKSINISSDKVSAFHVDGEYIGNKNKFEIEINAQSMKMLNSRL